MAFVLVDGPFASELAAASNSQNINYQGKVQGAKDTLASAPNFAAVAVPQGPLEAGRTNQSHIMENQHQDYHFRFWVIPVELRLSNPTINTDIPFLIWNTLPTTQTLTALNIQNSSVLTFDMNVTDTVRDHELRTINMQIGPGEANIDAIAQFIFTDGSFDLPVIATVSETFNLVPDVPVRETWKFLTDIITNYNGQEQRVALRRNPRRTMRFDVDILDLQDRQEQYELLFKNMGLQAIIPAYHHATQITANTEPGGSKYYFDPELTQMRVGESLVVLNPETEVANIANVIQIDADGAIVGSASGEQVTPAWYVYPAHAMVLRDGSGLNMQSVSGKMTLRAEGYATPTLPRPNAVPIISQLNGVNIMDRRPLVSADENFSYRLDKIDFETGAIDLQRKGDPHPRISGSRRWKVSRYDVKTRDEDWFREFIDQARGAHKAWLLPTFFPDLTYVGGATNLSGVITVEELTYPALFHAHGTWQQIMIEYDNLDPTFHTVQSATVNTEGTLTTLSLNPVLADDAEVSNIKSISFLLKVRGSDTIQRTHFALDTIYSWAIKTVDD